MAYSRSTSPQYTDVQGITDLLGLGYQNPDSGTFVSGSPDIITLSTLSDVEKYWVGCPVELSGTSSNPAGRQRTTVSAVDYSTGALSLTDNITGIPTGPGEARVKLLSFFTNVPLANGMTYKDINDKIIEAEDWVDEQIHHSYLAEGRQIKDEYFSFDTRRRRYYPYNETRPFVPRTEAYWASLDYNFMKPIDSSMGDSIKIWNGDDWEEWVDVKTLGSPGNMSDADYWIDYKRCEIYFISDVPPHADHAGVATYRIGGDERYPDSVPPHITRATKRRVGIDLLQSERFASMLPGGKLGALSVQENIAIWTRDIDRDLARKTITMMWTGPE